MKTYKNMVFDSLDNIQLPARFYNCEFKCFVDLQNCYFKNCSFENVSKLYYSKCYDCTFCEHEIGYNNNYNNCSYYSTYFHEECEYKDCHADCDGYSSNADFCKVDTNSIIYGTITGWKKLNSKNEYLLCQLEIPEVAKRTYYNKYHDYKMRAEYAKVISIVGLNSGKQYDTGLSLKSFIKNGKYQCLEYKVGQIVRPDKFNNDLGQQCSNGIHFFLDKDEAIDY